jgi:hypothetical protein
MKLESRFRNGVFMYKCLNFISVDRLDIFKMIFRMFSLILLETYNSDISVLFLELNDGD